MNLNIDKDFLTGLPEDTFENGKGNYEMVVAHETAVDDDSIERNKGVFGNNGWQDMSAYPHFFVDHTGIWQCASLDYQAWGAGQPANSMAVHVELCRRSNEDEFEQSMKYYTQLIAWLLNRRNLKFKHLGTFYTHQDVSENLGGTNHQDPVAYLKSHGVSVSDLIDQVKASMDSKDVSVKHSASKSNHHSDNNNGGAKMVKLPASADTWKTYKLNVQPVSKNSDWSLTPARYDGLEYKILDEPYNNVVTIDTSKGKRNIYVAPDTNAEIVNGNVLSNNSKSGNAGKLKIVGVSNAAIVMDSPNRNNSNNLGTASLGSTLPLNGSVKGKNSSSGYWEVKYDGQLGYITGKYGKQV
ncbi:hypothetical protein GCM10028778_11590 [Barrientosiimonas marina]|uniref:Autolysin n=1 Tax=Lentibacillus kimchii TaxID=1542911 RepID=A0ABW2V0H6_9BACI